jgi:hypothetical protein
MKATKLPASKSAQQKRRPGIADVDQQVATLPEEQWQHGGKPTRLNAKKIYPRPELDAAHDDARRAEDGCSAHGMEDAQRVELGEPDSVFMPNKL